MAVHVWQCDSSSACSDYSDNAPVDEGVAVAVPELGAGADGVAPSVDASPSADDAVGDAAAAVGDGVLAIIPAAPAPRRRGRPRREPRRAHSDVDAAGGVAGDGAIATQLQLADPSIQALCQRIPDQEGAAGILCGLLKRTHAADSENKEWAETISQSVFSAEKPRSIVPVSAEAVALGYSAN